MPEEDRLTLVSEVEDEFTEPLERMEQALEDLDDKIQQTGKGQNKVTVQVEPDGVLNTLAQVEALNKEIDQLDNNIEIGFDESNIPDDSNLSPSPMQEGTVGEPVTSGGRESFDFNIDDENVLPRGSASLRGYRDFNRRFSEIGDISGVEIDEVELATTANPPTHFDAPFMQGTGTADRLETAELMSELLDEDDPIKRDFDAVDKLFSDQTEVSDTVEEKRARYGIDVPDLEDDMGGFGSFFDDDSQFEQFISQLKKMKFTMGKFHQVIASLIPLTAVFVGALPAAITAVGALGAAALGAAGALAGIGALGAMGIALSRSGEVSMEPIQEEISDIKNAFVEAFGPLAETLAPTLQSVMQQFKLMMGPLASASSGLLQFRDEFKGLSAFISNNLPSLVSDVLAFSHAMMPMFKALGGFLADTDVLGFLAAQFRKALPAIMLITSSLVELVPALIHVSQGFLKVAAVMFPVIELMSILINQFPILGEMIGIVVAGYAALVAYTTLAWVASTGLTGQILNLAASFGAYAITLLSKVVPGLAAYTGSTWAAYAATAALVGVLTFGLAPVISQAASAWGGMGKNIKNARKEMERFAKSGTALGGSSFGPNSRLGSNGANVYRDNSSIVIDAGGKDSAARQQYASQYEQQQHVDSVFGG